MIAQSSPLSHSATPAALPGTWKLRAGRAITLNPREDGVLRVAHGSLWATFDGPHAGLPNALGDHFVEIGDTLRVAAGQRLVLESFSRAAPAYFSWDPLAAPAPVPRFGLADALQPLADLRLALLLGARAIARLGAGLGRVAWQALVPPRPVAPRGLNAHCKA
jgi:hypothetical protein